MVSPTQADIQEVRKAVEELQTVVRELTKDHIETKGLTVKLVQAIEGKVIPKLDEHDSFLSTTLPSQLEQSFTKQGELLKSYVENRLSPPVNERQTTQGGGQRPQAGGFDLGNVFSWVQEQANQAGGLRNLLSGGSRTPAYESEINLLEKEMINRTRLEFRDLLRERLHLPALPEAASASTATGPVVVKTA